MNRYSSKHVVYILGSVLVYLLFWAGGGLISYERFKHRTYDQIDDKLLIAANSLKYMLAPDFHDRAINPESISYDEELGNRATISEFALHSDFAYLYTLVESKGRFYFTAPTVTEKEAAERKRWYYHPYDDIPESFRQAFEREEVVYTEYEDQWGRFRSIAVPQRSPGGRLYLACADFDISNVKDLLFKNTVKSLLILSIFTIPLIVFILTFIKINKDQCGLAVKDIEEKEGLEGQLRDLLDELELRVEERTAKLKTVNEKLELEVEEHKRTQTALKESESRIRLITDSLPVLISLVDRDIHYRFVNREYEVWHGRPREEFIGKHPVEFMGREAFQTLEPYMRAALAGETVSYEGQMPTPDGNIRYFFSRNIPHRNEDGEVVGFIALVEDITERKKVEESLKENEERYRTVVEESFDGLVLHDGNQIVFNNRSAEELLGYEPGELIGLEFKRLTMPESWELMLQYEQMQSKGETPASGCEVKMVRNDGTKFDAEVSSRRVFLNNEPFVQTWFRDISGIKSATEAIDFERRQLLSIFNSLDQIVYVSDPFTYEMLFANQRLQDLTGEDPSGQLCYKYLQNFESPCDFCTNPIILSNGGQPYRWEYRNPVSNIDVAIVDQIVRWPDGRDVRLEIAVDITEKKQAEESLRASENKLRSIFEAMTDVIIILDAEGRFLEVAPTHMDIHYLQPTLLQGKSVKDFFPPEKADEFIRKIDNALSEDKPIYIDYELTINQDKVYFGATISPLSSDTVILVARNINERKQAEEALREREEKYRILADNITDNIWILDLNDLRFTYISPSVIDITGYSADEAIGFQLSDMLTPPSFELATSILDEELVIDQAADSTRSLTLELEHFCKDGSTVWTEASMSFMRDQAGRPKAILGVSRDISERKKLQTQLQQAQKMETIGTLAGGIAHDFNNILQGILGYAEIARHKVAVGKDVLQELDVVIQAGTRATELINHVLSFSRQNKVERKEMDMGLVVKEALKLLRASLPTTIEIHQKIEVTSEVVLADPTQMHQVIMNLGANAAHAMRESGGVLEMVLTSVTVDAALASQYPELNPGKYQRLSVSDTGHGMDQVTLARIFDPFFTTKEQGEGTGMGMSVVHGIIKNHGGAIMVYSEPGVGSTFHVYLPVYDSDEVTQPHISESTAPAKGTERILYVDDEELLVGFAEEMFSSLGYQVTIRTSSLEALELFKQDPDSFDLIITDQTMPKMTGYELAKELMKIRPDIPVILCTGFSATITPAKAKAAGIRELVMKPLLIWQIAKTIRDVLDGQSPSDQSTPQIEAETGKAETEPTRSLKVLVADDDVVSRKLATAFLEQAGHTVIAAENGQEALTLLDREDFDFIIMDGEMPVMDGITATKAIRNKEKEAQGGHIPILAITGYSAESDKERFLAAGMDGIISKPITASKLIQSIEDIINKKDNDG